MVEVNNKALHEFNANIMQGLADKFGTINKGAPYQALKYFEKHEAWQAAKMMANRKGET